MTVTAGDGGSVSPGSVQAAYGTAYSVDGSKLNVGGIEVVATPGDGYRLLSWSSISGTVTGDLTIAVSFEAIPVETVIVSPTELQLDLNGSRTWSLSATVSPADALDRTVAWSSGDTSVVTVDSDGNVAAVSIGTATVMAIAGGVSAGCSVTVVDTSRSSVTVVSVGGEQIGQPLDGYVFGFSGMTPGSMKVIELRISNSMGFSAGAVLKVEDLTGSSALAEQMTLSCCGRTIALSEIGPGSIPLDDIADGSSVTVLVSVMLVQSDRNNEVQGQSLEFGLAVEAAQTT